MEKGFDGKGTGNDGGRQVPGPGTLGTVRTFITTTFCSGSSAPGWASWRIVPLPAPQLRVETRACVPHAAGGGSGLKVYVGFGKAGRGASQAALPHAAFAGLLVFSYNPADGRRSASRARNLLDSPHYYLLHFPPNPPVPPPSPLPPATNNPLWDCFEVTAVGRES